MIEIAGLSKGGLETTWGNPADRMGQGQKLVARKAFKFPCQRNYLTPYQVDLVSDFSSRPRSPSSQTNTKADGTQQIRLVQLETFHIVPCELRKENPTSKKTFHIPRCWSGTRHWRKVRLPTVCNMIALLNM